MMEPRVRAVGGAFASLDVVNISGVFDRRPKFMKTVPVMPRGVFRSAMKLALQEILDATEAESHVRATRGWKLFLLLPRMLLFRPARGSLIHSQPAAGDVPRTTTMMPRELPAPRLGASW